MWICPCGTTHYINSNTTNYHCAYCRAEFTNEIANVQPGAAAEIVDTPTVEQTPHESITGE